MNDRNEQYQTSRKVRDRSVALLLLGLVLFVSPMAGIFEIDAKLGGIPITLIYLFLVWAILIAGTYALSRKLRDHAEYRDDANGGARR